MYQPNLLRPEDFKWEIKRQKKLLPDMALVGSIVDQVITEGMRVIRDGGTWYYDPMKRAVEILDDLEEFSWRWRTAAKTRGKWPKDMDRPLESIYFNHALTPGERENVEFKMRRCLKNLEGYDVLQIASEVPKACLMLPEEGMLPVFEWFDPEGSGKSILLRAKQDFAIHSKEITMIWDWKCGIRHGNAENDIHDQLHMYALYAKHMWNADYDKMKMRALWLLTGETTECTVSEDRLSRMWWRIYKTKKEIESKLNLAKNSTELMEMFPGVCTERACKACPFRACPIRVKKNQELLCIEGLDSK